MDCDYKQKFELLFKQYYELLKKTAIPDIDRSNLDLSCHHTTDMLALIKKIEYDVKNLKENSKPQDK